MVKQQHRTESDIFELIGKMNDVKDEMLSTLSTTYQDEETLEFMKTDFEEIKIGDRIVLDEAELNYATCIHSSDNHIVFLTVNQPGYIVKPHTHDFEEVIQVIKGKIIERISHQLAVRGEQIIIRPFQLHSFESPDFSVYTATIRLK